MHESADAGDAVDPAEKEKAEKVKQCRKPPKKPSVRNRFKAKSYWKLKKQQAPGKCGGPLEDNEKAHPVVVSPDPDSAAASTVEVVPCDFQADVEVVEVQLCHDGQSTVQVHEVELSPVAHDHPYFTAAAPGVEADNVPCESSMQPEPPSMRDILGAVQQQLPALCSACMDPDGETVIISLHSRHVSRVVQRSIAFKSSGEVATFAHGHALLRSNISISPLTGANEKDFVQSVLSALASFRQLEICVGAQGEKGKVWWKSCLDTCHIDMNNFHETRYSTTLRSNSCEYLVNQPKRMCSNCWQVNRKLMKRKTPSKNTPHKKKPFQYMTSAEKKARDKRKTKTVRNLNRKIARMKKKIAGLITAEGRTVDKALDDTLGATLDRELKKMKEKGSNDEKDKFLEIFLEQQIAARDAKGNHGIQWHPLMIRFALQLKYCSQASLSSARNYIRLPSDRLLWDYTHIYEAEPGIKEEFINEVAEKVKSMKYPYQAYHVLLFDEMTVKENLVQRKGSGKIVGYVKLNEVQTELAELQAKLQAEAEGTPCGTVTPPTAKKMLTYMVRGTANDIQCCIASYPVHSLSKEDLHMYTWEVTASLETAGVKIVAFVADGSPVNRSFFQMHPPAEQGTTASGLVFKTPNPFDLKRSIFFVPDPPHALKTTRNCLLNSGRKKSRNLIKNGQRMTWATIIRLYRWKSEQTIKKLPRLTAACVHLNAFSRMSVPYAARVCSNSVSEQLRLLAWPDSSELSLFGSY